MTTQQGCLTMAGLVSAVVLSTGAEAQITVACSPNTTFTNVQVCEVNLTAPAYVAKCDTKLHPSTICEESFDAAIKDAKSYFNPNNPPTQSYVILIPAGTYDFSYENTGYNGQLGAVNIDNIGITSAGCLENYGDSLSGTFSLSGKPCLIISGAGPTGSNSTTLTSANGFPTFAGRNTSHVIIERMTLNKDVTVATTQGTYVTNGTTYVPSLGITFPNVTIDIESGFKSPDDLWKLPASSSGDQMYMRAYTNTSSPALVQSVNTSSETNAQIPLGWPNYNGTFHGQEPTQDSQISNRWTITLSNAADDVPTYYYNAPQTGLKNLLCVKIDDGASIYFDDEITGSTSPGGTDVILNKINWIGAARSTFHGIAAAPPSNNSALGVQIYNSGVLAPSPVGSTTPCLTTESGGVQIGDGSGGVTYGNLVYGFTSNATGDDSIAVFNDIGGTAAAYPYTNINNSQISNSFARDINLFEDPSVSNSLTYSLVKVDAATKSYINTYGNCDPIVEHTGNCPVTYMGPNGKLPHNP